MIKTKFFNKILIKFYLLIHEHSYKKRLKYLYENNGSKRLLVVFSGFSPTKPLYNYVRTIKDIKTVNKLFILDDFGFRGSYYWFENGDDFPLQLTKELIEIKSKGCEELYTLGTSKGGTCAIYFGLVFNAKHVYSGACQYLVGNYLNLEERLPILSGMLGAGFKRSDVDRLNNMMPNLLKKCKDARTVVHLLYSKKEHTYDEHIVYLIEDLILNNIPYTEVVEDFENHNDVGKYFIPYIKKELRNVLKI